MPRIFKMAFGQATTEDVRVSLLAQGNNHGACRKGADPMKTFFYPDYIRMLLD